MDEYDNDPNYHMCEEGVCKMCTFHQTTLHICIPLEDGTETLENLPSTMILHLPSDLSLQDKVRVYGAVVSQKQQLGIHNLELQTALR